MEFNSGVVFIKDNNKNTNYFNAEGKPSVDAYLDCNVFCYDEDYFNENTGFYYRQYAIGNMGNDKKNVEIFHSENSCCVENCNNNSEYQKMLTPIELSVDKGKDSIIWIPDIKGDTEYEFRYPEDPTIAQKNSFERFYNWMAENNPMTATYESITPIVFGEYEFKKDFGSNTGISLKGTKITKILDYNPLTDEWSEIDLAETTFTKDTYGYRVAKMLHECEDHLIMDSIVFHYLFIERHTMVDNVAKNTFWSSEDLEHWDLTKDYDNDTADGNNNTGHLAFSYGMETLDKVQKGDGAVNAFNASESAWLRLVHSLPEAQRALYQKITDTHPEAWSEREYLKEFEKHQNIIPEICWIENFFHHYIRPRRMGFDPENNYIRRLEGGKKVHQRKQYETY
jgi:hypothetical protein